MLKELKSAEKRTNMYRKINKKGEKVNIILNGVKEVDEMFESCPVDEYAKSLRLQGGEYDDYDINLMRIIDHKFYDGILRQM